MSASRLHLYLYVITFSSAVTLKFRTTSSSSQRGTESRASIHSSLWNNSGKRYELFSNYVPCIRRSLLLYGIHLVPETYIPFSRCLYSPNILDERIIVSDT